MPFTNKCQANLAYSPGRNKRGEGGVCQNKRGGCGVSQMNFRRKLYQVMENG